MAAAAKRRAAFAEPRNCRGISAGAVCPAWSDAVCGAPKGIPAQRGRHCAGKHGRRFFLLEEVVRVGRVQRDNRPAGAGAGIPCRARHKLQAVSIEDIKGELVPGTEEEFEFVPG